MFGRQPRAVVPPTSAPEMRAGEEADDDPADDPQVSMAGSIAWRRSRTRQSQERQDRGDHRVGMGVVRGVPRARDHDDPAVGQPGVERVVAAAEAGRLSPPSSWRTGWRTLAERLERAAGIALSASSSRTIVGAAATRSGQTGSAR